ncbi:hypothetical protein HID58_037559, partial [Brassica napus]
SHTLFIPAMMKRKLRTVKSSPTTRSTKCSTTLRSRPERIGSIFPLTDLEEPWIDMTTREYLESIVSLCVKKLNEEKHPDGPLMEYQAKAMDFGGKPPFPILCRPASTIS